MSIRGIILDLSGTTFKPDGTTQDGIQDLISFCREKDLKIAFTSNRLYYANALSRSGLNYDLLVTPREVGIKKPSVRFIQHIEHTLDIPKEKFIYIGDNDKTDAFCASNAKILYFCASWANPNAIYGIPVRNPHSLIKIIRFFLKPVYWGWRLERTDNSDRQILALSLLDCRSSLTPVARGALKDGNPRFLPFFMYHLISSVYLSGIYKDVDLWATYPSHERGTSLNPTMSWIIEKLTKEFKDEYLDLFIRHKTSMDSGASRYKHIPVHFSNQTNTVVVNPEFKEKIKQKNILVLDDFITKGYSLEWARNLLYQAEASNVIGVSIGKYTRDEYTQISISGSFNPFEPINADDLNIQSLIVHGEIISSMQDILESTFKDV